MGSVTYRLAVQQDMIGTGNRLGGLMSVAGRLSGDFKVIFELLHNPNAVVLTIEVDESSGSSCKAMVHSKRMAISTKKDDREEELRQMSGDILKFPPRPHSTPTPG
jgi:hypothetical protein